jgi:hypothetical protein
VQTFMRVRERLYSNLVGLHVTMEALGGKRPLETIRVAQPTFEQHRQCSLAPRPRRYHPVAAASAPQSLALVK